VGALLILVLANWPWTLLAIKDTNDKLMGTELGAAGPESRALVVKWNKLHVVRTVLGALAAIAFLFALF
jgi:hypothetical protein